MISFTYAEINACFKFALNMRGKHNPNMIQKRSDWQILTDDFRGKLGEIAVRKYFKANILNAKITTDLDFSITPRGQWDIVDIEVNGKACSIKSIKPRSKFLLIEKNRYDSYGNYRYKNNNNESVPVDYYILVKVAFPQLSNNVFKYKSFEQLMNNENYKGNIYNIDDIKAKVLGGISHDEFWNKKVFAPKGIKCTVKNLEALTNGITINELPDKICGNESQNNILQQDNYIINSSNGLYDLKELIW